MTIIVTSGGPVVSGLTIPSIGTATLGFIINAIADDIDDLTGEYNDQIAAAVFGAIRFCERETFYFNETRDVTFATVDGQEFYTAADNSNIATLVRIETAWKENSSDQRTELRKTSPWEIEALSDASASRGEPTNFCYFDQKVRLYPVPSAEVFTIRLGLSPYRLAPLTSVDDTNAWLTEAYDMVKARAKYILSKDTLKDAAVATEALGDFQVQRQALLAETSARVGTGQIRVTCF